MIVTFSSEGVYFQIVMLCREYLGYNHHASSLGQIKLVGNAWIYNTGLPVRSTMVHKRDSAGKKSNRTCGPS